MVRASRPATHWVITDEQVLEIRLLRHIPSPVSHQTLADYYGVSLKTIKRICFGQKRLKAGGPIERPIVHKDLWPFDQNRTIWCPTCGTNVHPPCMLCNLRNGTLQPTEHHHVSHAVSVS
jgi:hypothetical protein